MAWIEISVAIGAAPSEHDYQYGGLNTQCDNVQPNTVFDRGGGHPIAVGYLLWVVFRTHFGREVRE